MGKQFKHYAAALVVAASSVGFWSSADASLLTPAYQSQLETWLGQGPLTFTSIYSGAAGDPNFNSYDWHAAVDGKGATFTLMEIPGGTYTTTDLNDSVIPFSIDQSIIGGYNPQSWNSSSNYHITNADADRTAFIYNLSTSLLLRQILSTDPDPYNVGGYQTYNNSNYGPTFGGGHDITVYYGDLSHAYASPLSYGASYQPGLFGPTGAGYFSGYLRDFPLARLETYTYSSEEVPEPSAIALIAMALLSLVGLGLMRRRADG